MFRAQAQAPPGPLGIPTPMFSEAIELGASMIIWTRTLPDRAIDTKS